MRTKRLILTFAAAALAMTACMEKMDQPSAEEMEQFEITALNLTEGLLEEDPDTRVTVGEETDATYFYWSPKESVGVYGSRTKNAKFTTTNTAPAQTITLKGSLSLFDSPKYTYYPYNSANGSNPYTAVVSSLPAEQVFDTDVREFSYDFKFGTATSSGWSKYTYDFASPLTYMRFIIDATGSVLEGDRLQSITLRAPEGTEICGSFKANLSAQTITWTETATSANEVTVTLSNTPKLDAGVTEVVYMIIAPESVQGGTDYTIVLRTDNHVATIEKVAGKTWVGKTTYKQTMTLANLNMKVQSRMNLDSFGFTVDGNEGKILAKELYFDTANGKTANRGVSKIELDIDEENATITGCIPYLYDFKLKPTFDVNSGVKVYAFDDEVISGETELDFSQPFELSLVSGNDIKTYTVSLTNTGLPVVVLTSGTEGDVTWSATGMKVKAKDSEWTESDKIAVYNPDGTANLEEAACGFRLRGNTTQTFPKKPFAIKLAKKANLLDIMPDGGKHKRWCLLANYIDRSLMRNAVTNVLANLSIDAWQNSAAEPGLIWNPSGKNVELVIDGIHVGNYYLCEQIKIDGDRLDITDCYEDVVEDGNTNPTLADCGYLLEFDDAFDEAENGQFVTKRYLPVMFKDKTPEAIRNQIRTKIDNIETNLKKNTAAGYEAAFADLDINSVIDWWFIHELAMNDEFKHPKSVYMYIDGDGKLSAGPVWDFDYQTYPNVDGITEIYNAYKNKSPRPGTYSLSVSKWLISNENAKSSSSFPSKPTYTSESGNADKPYMWYPLLFKSEVFRQRVQERWQIVKPYWDGVYYYITTIGETNAVSEAYNFAMWPLEAKERFAIRNQNNYNWFVDFSGDERIETWDGVVANFRDVLRTRLEEMDRMITSGDFYPAVSSGSGSGTGSGSGSGSGSGNWWDNIFGGW